MKYIIILSKTFIFYILMMLFYRMMGKREVGELKIGDLVVSMLLTNIIASGIESYESNIFITILPVCLLVVMQIVISKVLFKYESVRKLVDGEASIIIDRGKVNFSEMLKQRYNLDDLLVELRSKGIKSIEEVDYAILETSGKLSVFKKSDDKSSVYPLPVIIDGVVQEDVLMQIKKDKDWLDKMISNEGYKLEDIFYGFYRKNNLYLIKNENIK